MLRDGSNHEILDVDNDLSFYHGYEPWQTTIQGIKRATAYIKPFQQLSQQHKINKQDIAAALAKRKLLRQTKTIQLPSNRKFASTSFNTTELLQGTLGNRQPLYTI